MEKKIVSYCLFTYNQQDYVREAVESALAQTYSPMEIIISDDCSSDSTYDIILSVVKDYSGPHIIKLNRNYSNMKPIPHFNKVMSSLVEGDIVILAAGDDISFKERAQRSVTDIEKYNLQCISYNGYIINSKGEKTGRFIIPVGRGMKVYDIEDFIKKSNFNIHGASKAIRRSVFDEFGCFNDNCPTEDSTLNLRGLLVGYVGESSEPMIEYRVHGNNLSGANNLLKLDYNATAEQYLRDIDKVNLDSYTRDRLYNRIDIYRWRNKIMRASFVDLIRHGDIFKLIVNESFKIREKLSIIKRSLRNKK